MSNPPEIWVVLKKDGTPYTGNGWYSGDHRIRAGATKAQANRIRGQVGGRIVRYVPAEDQ